ncbi:MAG: Hpt domain-containing protein [Bacteroidales bacterium]|jgi:HPt (histidine-containing phosphotransfer) domain-containing protein|nr:Hpt domain-containing protein [Bacteroidales bacterium]
MAEFGFINTEYLEMVAGSDPELKKDLVRIFREQVIEFYSEMQTLLSQKKYTELGLLAHKAKSSVAIMGMDSLAEMLKTLELNAKDGLNPSEYGSYIERFGSDTRSALAELETLF